MANDGPQNEYRCYHKRNGSVCNAKLADGLLTGVDWIRVHCPKCKRLVVFPKPY
jgi:phage FluMu protein Com